MLDTVTDIWETATWIASAHFVLLRVDGDKAEDRKSDNPGSIRLGGA